MLNDKGREKERERKKNCFSWHINWQIAPLLTPLFRCHTEMYSIHVFRHYLYCSLFLIFLIVTLFLFVLIANLRPFNAGYFIKCTRQYFYFLFYFFFRCVLLRLLFAHFSHFICSLHRLFLSFSLPLSHAPSHMQLASAIYMYIYICVCKCLNAYCFCSTAIY